jgi:hypothetical protein
MNRIKTVNEFFKVLSDGAVVELFDGYDGCNVYYKLIDNNIYISGFPDKDYMLSAAVSMDFEKNVYVKYVKPPEWYDNIPKQGRLCWVWDSDYNQRYPGVVISYKPDLTYRFIIASGSSFKNAKLMTSDEIKRYYE